MNIAKNMSTPIRAFSSGFNIEYAEAGTMRQKRKIRRQRAHKILFLLDISR